MHSYNRSISYDVILMILIVIYIFIIHVSYCTLFLGYMIIHCIVHPYCIIYLLFFSMFFLFLTVLFLHIILFLLATSTSSNLTSPSISPASLSSLTAVVCLISVRELPNLCLNSLQLLLPRLAYSLPLALPQTIVYEINFPLSLSLHDILSLFKNR